MHIKTSYHHWLPKKEKKRIDNSKKKLEAANNFVGFGNKSQLEILRNCRNKLREITFSGISGITVCRLGKNLIIFV